MRPCHLEKHAIFLYVLKMRFEWDERKAAGNVAKHRIAFDVAITAFDVPSRALHPTLSLNC